jgi:hypothetical protein
MVIYRQLRMARCLLRMARCLLWWNDTTEEVLLAGVAVAITVLGLLFAVYVVGPAVRRIFGAPLGFREHFTSPANFYQALVVQAIFLALAFFVFGIASERLSRTARYADAVWIANPATVGFGFVGYKGIYHALHSPSYVPEYDNPAMLLIFSLAAPVLFAGCFYLGARCRIGCTVLIE